MHEIAIGWIYGENRPDPCAAEARAEAESFVYLVNCHRNPRYNDVAAIVEHLGAPGDASTGVTITSATLDTDTMGVADSGGKIRLDVAQLTERGARLESFNPGRDRASVHAGAGASILGEEARHDMDMGEKGQARPTSGPEAYALEVSGVGTGQRIDQGNRLTSELWNRHMTAGDRAKAVHNRAGRSTNQWCRKKGGC